MSKKVTAIVQARMGSSRLPGKILMEIENRPMLWHVVNRILQARLVEDVIIATSVKKEDDKVEEFSYKNKFKFFRGSEEDCLDRYYNAAKEFRVDNVVRITADCPLICPEVIDEVVEKYCESGFDYVTNTLLYTYPDGCDVEVFSFRALEKAWKESSSSVEREHVTQFMRNSGKFNIKNVENSIAVDAQKYKWSVDRSEDLEFVKVVYRLLYRKKKNFSMKEIMNLVNKNPSLEKINDTAMINEGYYKSFLKAPKVKQKKPKIGKSIALKNKGEKLIPDCSQTFSKGPSQFVQGVAPVYLEKGKGSHVWDIDGNEYIDYAMALGAVILGHNYPSVTREVKRAMDSGTTFTLPHWREVELAERLCEIIPCAEMVRFGKNGSDATSGAVRVARAFTGRNKIACCGYHGWQDWYIGTTSRRRGVPEAVQRLTLTFEYNKIASLEKLFIENPNQVACVILEPFSVDEPKEDFLQKVKELTHKNGALLIFDEIVTGFRIALGGAQEYFGVTPDVACFGKAMANGFPISAIVGQKEIMKLFKEVFYSFTFGGEVVSISAAISTINEMQKKDAIKHLWEQGRKLRDGYNVLADEYGLKSYTYCKGLPPRTAIRFVDHEGEENLLLKSFFQQECIKRGILFTGSNNICFGHSDEDIDKTLRVFRTVLEILKEAIATDMVKDLLEGSEVKPVFRKI